MDPIFLILAFLTLTGMIVVAIIFSVRRKVVAKEQSTSASPLIRLPYPFDDRQAIIYQVVKPDTARVLFSSLGLPLEKISFNEREFYRNKLKILAMAGGDKFIALVKRKKTKDTTSYLEVVYVSYSGIAEYLGLDYNWQSSMGCSSTLYLAIPSCRYQLINE